MSMSVGYQPQTDQVLVSVSEATCGYVFALPASMTILAIERYLQLMREFLS